MMYEQPKRYVRLPNEVFAIDLNTSEIAVYAYLLFCEDHKKHLCYPSYGAIGRALHMSTNTVRKYVSALEAKGLILTEPTTVTLHGRRRNGNLRYTILPISEAAARHLARMTEKARQKSARQRAEEKLRKYDRAHPA